MTIALWIVQILLALLFVMAGLMKVSQPVARLQERMSWAKHAAPWMVRLVGVLEILGAIGLILPKATNILPWLTPVAAIGLVLTMLGAIIAHFGLKEVKQASVPFILLLLSLFIVLGYFVFVPIA